MTLYIAGTDHTTSVRRVDGWGLNKRLAAETFTFKFVNTVVGPGAFRPASNSSVLAYHGSDLLFGGRIKAMDEYRLGGDGPVCIDVSCRGWEALAEESIITATIALGPIITRVYGLYQTYLQPKGVLWLGATSGGLTMTNDVTVVRTSLADLLNQMCKQVNYLWRINGEKYMGINLPGSLLFPDNPLTSAHFEMGSIRRHDKAYEYANRLILMSGGSGDAMHSETHVGNGVKTRFPLNVEPKAPVQDSETEVWTYYWPTETKINGVTKLLDGSAGWFYDEQEHHVWTNGAPVPNGHTVQTGYKIGYPATIRAWLPEALTSAGGWNFATMIDKMINMTHMSDVVQIKQWGDVELARRAAEPLVVTGTTRRKGYYPLMTGQLLIPEHVVNNDYLIQNVRVRDSGISETEPNHLLYDLEFIEGGIVGRQYETLFKEFLGGGSGGSTSVGSGGGSGGGTGVAELPIGATIHLAGHNDAAVYLTTTWSDAPQAIPNRFGGAGFPGVWRLRPPMYQLEAGTVEARLWDQTNGVVLASCSTNAVGALLSNAFGFPEVTFVAPLTVVNVLLQVRVTSGARDCVIGHATVVRDS